MKTTRAAVSLAAVGAAVVGAQTQTLVPWAFSPLPVGSVQPLGWLLGELQTMADGLAGHEHDFYVYVNQSSWLNAAGVGGTEYSNLNEGLPYWFNGLVPAAYVLGDERLKGQVHAVAQAVLDAQSSDGWIGPEVPSQRNFWARTPFLLGLTQLVEANATWEAPALAAMRSFMNLTNAMLSDGGQGFTDCPAGIDCSWGQVRVHDLIISIQWLLENYPSDQDALLWENMQMFYNLTNWKWDAWYQPGVFSDVVANPTTSNPDFPFLHGVNVGQGLKASAVINRFINSNALVEAAANAVNFTFTYHGAPSGTVLADEIERDLAPYMGSELCTAVETGFSLSYLYQALGTNDYADRAERVIFNALPVMLTTDMWARQYMDQPNQPWATNDTEDFDPINGQYVFTTANSGAATTYGMEPQYPCCTVNHPQGYPKFVTHSWAAVGSGNSAGLAHMLLSPSRVSTSVATIECDTDYPFGNVLTYTVDAAQDFDLYLRVPSWADPAISGISFGLNSNSTQTEDATMLTSTNSTNSTNSTSGNTTSYSALSPDPETGMHQVHLNAGLSYISYLLLSAPGPNGLVRTEARANDTVAVYAGNLLYALDVGSPDLNTSSLPHAWYDAEGPGISGLPYPQLRDYYYPNGSAWNVAIDPATIEYHYPLLPLSTDLPTPVFAYGAPPTYMTVRGCLIDWPLYLGVIPDRVPGAGERQCLGPSSTYKLIPYGSAKVHMSELPVINSF